MKGKMVPCYLTYKLSHNLYFLLISRALQQLSDLRDEEVERHIVLSAVDHDIRESSSALHTCSASVLRSSGTG